VAPPQDVLIEVGKIEGGLPCHSATADLDISYYKTEKSSTGAQFKDGFINQDGWMGG
jgi:hypothetical protein